MNEIEVAAPFTAEKLVCSKKIVELVCDQKSSSIAFTVKQFSVENKKSTCNIYRHSAMDMQISPITRGSAGVMSSTPQFITDYGVGTVNSYCFLRGGQVWNIPASGGEAQQVTHFPLDVEHYRVFINEFDVIWMMCVFEVYPDKSPKETAEFDANKSKDCSAMEFDSLMVRHWDRWGSYEKRNHLFVCAMSVTEDGLLTVATDAQKEPILLDLMFNWSSDCPGKPFQGEEDFAVSPDGLQCAFSCRDVDVDATQPKTVFKAKKDMAWTTEMNVYLVDLPKHPSQVAKFRESTARIVKGWDSEIQVKPKNSDDADAEAGARVAPALAVYTCITPKGANVSPLYSPNGKFISLIHRARPQFESDKGEIHLYDVATGRLHSGFTTDIDLSFDSVEWCSDIAETPTGETPYPVQMFVNAQYHGACRIFKLSAVIAETSVDIVRIDVMNGDNNYSAPKFIPRELLHARRTQGGPGGQVEFTPEFLYFMESSLLSPPELKIVELTDKDAHLFSCFALADGKPRCVTHAASGGKNTSLIATGKVTAEGPVTVSPNRSHNIWSVYECAPEFCNNDIGMPDAIHKHYFMGANGEYCQAWYLPPVGVDTSVSAAGSVPLAVIIHGGPQGAIMNSWHYRWNMSIFAARGYGVIAINFHGSTGFGQDYVDSISRDWGGKPYDDIMMGVRYTLNQYSYLNPDKVAGLGASYGGYMINWINGHNPDGLFKCLVNHDGVFSNHSMYFSTEELFFSEYEFGLPWEQEDDYKKFSPASYVQHWNTPTLVIHGGKDYRVPETEGIATFTALQRRGIPSKFLYFPDENHWVLKPMNSIKWHDTIFAWLKQYLETEKTIVAVK